MEGFTNINVDLINCFPGETAASWKKTLKNVLMLKPEHVSVYNLIVEEGTPMSQMISDGIIALPSEDEMAAIDGVTREYLNKNRYHRYEVSNFAREGFESRHNKGYWTGTEYPNEGYEQAYMIYTTFKGILYQSHIGKDWSASIRLVKDKN